MEKTIIKIDTQRLRREMARVNIETRAIAESRTRTFTKILGWRLRDTMGLLLLLWHDSQEARKYMASKEEIKGWLEADDGEKDSIFAALLKSGFLRETETDIFEIRGNKKHVNSLQVLSQRGQKGGVASGERRRKKTPKKVNEIAKLELDRTTVEAAASKVEANTMQCNSIQNNADQSNATQCNPKQSNSIQELIPPPSRQKSPRVAVAASPKGAITDFSGDVFSDLLVATTENLQQTWIQVYKDVDWIKNEMRKAKTWIVANPRKAPKNFGQFMTNWLTRGWENHRKGIPSRRMTPAEVNAEAAKDIWTRIDQGGAL